MKGYKVVKRDNNKLVSATNQVVCNKNRVTYIPDRFVCPRKGYEDSYLFVFKNIEAAKEFCKHIGGTLEIWECEMNQVTSKGVFCSIYNMKRVWSIVEKLLRSHKKVDNRTMSTSLAIDRWGDNTIWAKNVKLLRKVN